MNVKESGNFRKVSKRVLLASILLAALAGGGFAAESKSADFWLSLGLNYEFSWEKIGDAKETQHGMGWQILSLYGFWNNNKLGIYSDLSLQIFIPFNALGNEGLDPFYSTTLGYVLGASFRVPFSETVALVVGLGPSIAYKLRFRVIDSFNILNSLDIGLGGDLGFKFNLSDMMFLQAGCKFGVYFVRWWEETDTWNSEYFRFALRPYLSVGLDF